MPRVGDQAGRSAETGQHMTGPVATTPDLGAIIRRNDARDTFRISFLANTLVLPVYDGIARDFGLSRGEYLLLFCLSHQPDLTAQDVARVTGRPRNTISRAVHRMLDEGYIDRRPDPVDGRLARLTIRPEGRRLHERIVRRFQEREAALLGVLDPTERAQLDRLLNKLVDRAIAAAV